MDYKELLNKNEYNFLRTNLLLKDRLLFLTVAGSHTYGTNVESSDMNIRGVVLERETDTLGLTDFEQYIDPYTDTVIYTLKKFLKLVKECNPNIIEMLYSKPKHYLYVSDLGKILLDNRDLFLTKRAAYSFGGYANAQLSRLENALARDMLSEEDSLEHINRSIENVVNSFKVRFKLEPEAIKTYVGSWHDGDDLDILVDFKLEHYPLSTHKSMIEEMANVVRNYMDTVGQRNKEKDDAHLNKHMMHLVRLFYMCNEILETSTLHTYREKEHDILMAIKNGFYRTDDGYVKNEFYVLLEELKRKCDDLKKTTTLPDFIDIDKYNSLVLKLYKEAMKN